jgi:CDP-diglyceride synthetase
MALTLRSAAVYIISMNRACPMPTKLYLSAAFLGGVVLLFSSRASVRNQNMRTTTLAGLLLLLWVGLNLAGFYYLPVADPSQL